jgi:ankyrin repeat protein
MDECGGSWEGWRLIHFGAASGAEPPARRESAGELGWACEACTFVNEDEGATACAVCGTATSEQRRAGPELAAALYLDLPAAVAARKAAAPPEVRAVVDGSFNDLMGMGGRTDGERKRISRAVVPWLVEAHAAAHGDPATKRLARLVLGRSEFSTNLKWAECWERYKELLHHRLAALGAPLGEAAEREGTCAVLGAVTLPPHELVAADRTRCAAAGRKHVLRSDMAGVVPLPSEWAFDEPVARQRHERVFVHMLVMMAQALNEQFHAMMREVLGPHIVAGEGVMAQNADGSWRLTPEKGVARMECKRVTDHAGARGCRPALNIDVLRVIGVCMTAEQLMAAVAALGARFGGCGRVKNGFAIRDASFMFNLRTLMTNLVVDFRCTFAQLAARPGIAAMWEAHATRSVPQGGTPRERWRAEAAEALAILTGGEFADKPVLFICEAQMLLDNVYQVRKHMHEMYKGYRADTDVLLYQDMVSETHKVEREALFAADGGTALRAACRDGDVAAAARLLPAAGEAERGDAFAVACARGRGALLAALPALVRGNGMIRAAMTMAGWQRAASFDAAVDMDSDVLAALLAAGGQGAVDRLDPESMTPLMRAARGGHEHAVRRLLELGAVVDRRSCGGRGGTALHMAAYGGNDAVVRRLLEAGADPRCGDGRNDGATALHAAVQQGHGGVVELLIAAGAPTRDLGGPRSSGTNVLLCDAAHGGHEAVLAQLLAAGAAIDEKDFTGFVALTRAARNGHESAVALLLAAGAEVDKRIQPDPSCRIAMHEVGATSLLIAATAGHEAIVGRLLDAGAAVDAASHSGMTPLLAAVDEGHAEVTRRLLAAGASLSQADSRGWTPLLFAVGHSGQGVGQAAVVEQLIEAGADLNVADQHGQTPLLIAVAKAAHAPANAREPKFAGHQPDTAKDAQRLRVVKLLTGAGAALDVTSKLGFTPLFAAAGQGSEAVVRCLLEAGAGASVTESNHGTTPLQIATRNGHGTVVALLRRALQQERSRNHSLLSAAKAGEEHGVAAALAVGAEANARDDDGFTALWLAVAYGRRTAAVAQLLAAGANVEMPAGNGSTPLVIAGQIGDVPVVEQLLAAGAGADCVKATDGISPIFMAAEYGHAGVVDLLAAAGASVDRANRKGTTPLYVAAVNGKHGSVAQLLAAGADPNKARQDEKGHTPLMAAVAMGHTDVVRLLLAAGADVGQADKRGATALLIGLGRGATANGALVMEMLRRAAAAGGSAGAPSSSPPPPPGADCPGRHGLQRFVTAGTGFGCDGGCGAAVARGAPMYGCRLCNHDVCEGCYAPPPPAHGTNGNNNDDTTGAGGSPADCGGEAPPLVLAAAAGDCAEVARLLAAGASVEAAGEGGDTPLFLAAANGHAEVAGQLLAAGAVPGKAVRGSAPLQVATQNGHDIVAALLLSVGAEFEE